MFRPEPGARVLHGEEKVRVLPEPTQNVIPNRRVVVRVRAGENKRTLNRVAGDINRG